MKYAAPRGTRDISDREAQAFHQLEEAARSVFRRYGYSEIRTPAFENAELFARAVGEATDIVEKEMYVFEDRGGRKLALRPEGTAGVVRAYLERGWDRTAGIKKLFYIGPMFRAERPQAGRYREFWQIGAEHFGNPSPQADADMLLMIRDVLAAYGLAETKFLLNSLGCAACRPLYREALVKYLSDRQSELCEDCRRRLDKNPLRCLDCKIDGPRLTGAPVVADSLCEACRLHDKELASLLASVGFLYEKAHRLVRGLDYYSRTVFEITGAGLGSQDALAAGGRYDSLVKTLGGPDVPAIGFALGMDRAARARHGDSLSKEPAEDGPRVFVALAGPGTGETGFGILQELRKSGLAAEIGSADKSLKAQLRWADAWKAGHAVIVGESELARGKVLLKDLRNHTQEETDAASLAVRIAARGRETPP
ncbi:MAG: histidine--tRNA ligase [Elusimicrobiota bacterium]